MSKSEKCVYVATEAWKLWVAVKKTNNQVQVRAQRASNCYVATQASNKGPKGPGQGTHKDVVENKNCSNVNIVNMQTQKPSWRDEQFKKPATMYKYKYRKHQGEVICDDKKCQAPMKTVHKGKNCPSIQSSVMPPVKPIMKNEDLWLREAARKSSSSLCSDKNCHSARCFKKITRCPMRPMCSDDENCQSAQCMWPKKPSSPVRQVCNDKNCQSAKFL